MSATAEIVALPVLTKRCPDCTIVKPAADFYVERGRKGGLSSYCRKCYCRRATSRYKESRRRASGKFNAKQWKMASPRKRRDLIQERFERYVKAKYGVTIEHVRATLLKQHGLCANRACGVEISLDVHGREANRAVIDHCHTTNRFRGLLCNKCNHAEGFYQHNKNRILGVIEYLDRSELA